MRPSSCPRLASPRHPAIMPHCRTAALPPALPLAPPFTPTLPHSFIASSAPARSLIAVLRISAGLDDTSVRRVAKSDREAGEANLDEPIKPTDSDGATGRM